METFRINLKGSAKYTSSFIRGPQESLLSWLKCCWAFKKKLSCVTDRSSRSSSLLGFPPTTIHQELLGAPVVIILSWQQSVRTLFDEVPVVFLFCLLKSQHDQLVFCCLFWAQFYCSCVISFCSSLYIFPSLPLWVTSIFLLVLGHPFV